MSYTCAVKSDTVAITIRSSSSLPVTDLFISEHTLNAPVLVSCRVDGATYPGLITEIDTVFAGARTTRWLISSFRTEVRLTYYVPGYFNGQVHWAALHTTPIFGITIDSVCCTGTTGNIDNDPVGRTDLSDLSFLVNYLIGMPSSLTCPSEANVNADEGNIVDLSDLSFLISFLTMRTPLPPCPTD